MLNSPPLIHSEEVECEVSMIGDESRPYCLPILKGGKHPDLKCISTETVSVTQHGPIAISLLLFCYAGLQVIEW